VKQEEKLAGIQWVQDSLNKVMEAGLLVDGSFGRHTRASVRRFQELSGISVDGQVGDATCAAIDAALANMSKSSSVSKLPADAAPVISSHKGPSMDLSSIINLAQMVAPQFAPALGAVNPLLPVALNVLGEALGNTAPHTADSVAIAASNKLPDELATAIKSASDAYIKHVASAALTASAAQSPNPASMAPSAVAAPVTPTAVIPGSVVTSATTGGMYIDRVSSGAMQFALSVGSALLGSGLLDPAGPLAGTLKAYPVAGAFLAVASWFIHDRMVKASNDATAATTPSK
jgi:peptidoglycan hydrolase-like protein with peptidoglycan-binding domain